MEEKITLCGDNCVACPRYNAHSAEELYTKMLLRSKEYQKVCKEVCTLSEYEKLEKAFFDKENNLRK